MRQTNAEKGSSDIDPRSLGMSMDDLNSHLQHKMQVSKNPSNARQSTQQLPAEATKQKVAYDFSSFDLKALDSEIAKAKMQADLVKLIAVLQAKVKLKSLGLLEKKKVLIELLLELLNARKQFLIDEHLYKYKDIVNQEIEEDREPIRLAFELLGLIVGSN